MKIFLLTICIAINAHAIDFDDEFGPNSSAHGFDSRYDENTVYKESNTNLRRYIYYQSNRELPSKLSYQHTENNNQQNQVSITHYDESDTKDKGILHLDKKNTTPSIATNVIRAIPTVLINQVISHGASQATEKIYEALNNY